MRALTLLPIVVLALAAGCGEEDEGAKTTQRPPKAGQQSAPAQRPPKARQQPAPKSLDVTAFLERAPRLKTASVRGQLIPIGGTRMVVSGKDASAIVFAPASFVQGIRRKGLPLVVGGAVRRLSKRQADRLNEQVSRLKRPTKPRRAARREKIVNARRKAGDPYLVLRQASPVRTRPRELRSLDKLERPAD